MGNLTLAEIDAVINLVQEKMNQHKDTNSYYFYRDINKKLIEIWKSQSK